MHYDTRPHYDVCVVVEEGVVNPTLPAVLTNNKLDLGAIARLRTVQGGIHKGALANSLAC